MPNQINTIYVSFLHPSNHCLNVSRDKIYDFKFLFEEAIDKWIEDQNRWAETVKRLMEQPLQRRRLYIASWDTNYGEKVALIWASTVDEARALALDKGAWPDFNIDELGVMPDESEVLFVKGGD